MKKHPWRLLIIGSSLLLSLLFSNPRPGAAHSRAPNNLSNSETDISGDYTVTGHSGSGTDYEGELRIQKQGKVYQFHWWAGNQFEGIGIVNGGYVAVSYSDDPSAIEDCGVVIYRILANGTLDGLWGFYGEDEMGTERAVHARGTGLTGSYNVTGTNLTGSSYKALLTITEKGAGYELQWRNEKGFGVRRGNTLSVAYGGEQCSWVAYEIKPNGELDGLWGPYGAENAGRERAVPK